MPRRQKVRATFPARAAIPEFIHSQRSDENAGETGGPRRRGGAPSIDPFLGVAKICEGEDASREPPLLQQPADPFQIGAVIGEEKD